MANTTQKILGITAPVAKGDWTATATYDVLNIVRHNGASYMAKRANFSVQPGVSIGWTSVWQLLAQDGEDAQNEGNGAYPRNPQFDSVRILNNGTLRLEGEDGYAEIFGPYLELGWGQDGGTIVGIDPDGAGEVYLSNKEAQLDTLYGNGYIRHNSGSANQGESRYTFPTESGKIALTKDIQDVVGDIATILDSINGEVV